MISAIETKGLSVTFSSRKQTVRALDGIDLCVQPGTVFGFLGPNGAGKTTTMHILLGFLEATAGEARIFGIDVRESIARQRLGYLPERPDTYRFLTGRELLSMAGRLFLLRGATLSSRIGEILRLLGLEEAADRKISTYSRGMMQRICLGQALINDPDLVILDEPTAGLDPMGRMDIRTLITRLRERGKTVFFSSHELSEVEMVCDHIAILARGRIVAEGPVSRLVPPDQNLEKFFLKVVAPPSAPPEAAP